MLFWVENNMNIITAKNIRRSFGKDNLITHVLRGIDIDIREGEFVAIESSLI